jgi:hypothetical protein
MKTHTTLRILATTVVAVMASGTTALAIPAEHPGGRGAACGTVLDTPHLGIPAAEHVDSGCPPDGATSSGTDDGAATPAADERRMPGAIVGGSSQPCGRVLPA